MRSSNQAVNWNNSIIADIEGNRYTFKKMPDDNYWMTANLNLNIAGSYCYNNDSANCKEYGRLYIWEAAVKGCQLLGEEWRLPTENEWRELARHYGGVRQDSEDNGADAFKALLINGISGFNAVLGGSRNLDSSFARLEGHGLYWSGTEGEVNRIIFYNFGKGSQILNRHPDGEKERAFSVRCIKSNDGLK